MWGDELHGMRPCLIKDEKLVAWRCGSWVLAFFRKVEKSCGCFWRPTALPVATQSGGNMPINPGRKALNECLRYEQSSAMSAAPKCPFADISGS